MAELGDIISITTLGLLDDSGSYSGTLGPSSAGWIVGAGTGSVTIETTWVRVEVGASPGWGRAETPVSAGWQLIPAFIWGGVRGWGKMPWGAGPWGGSKTGSITKTEWTRLP